MSIPTPPFSLQQLGPSGQLLVHHDASTVSCLQARKGSWNMCRLSRGSSFPDSRCINPELMKSACFFAPASIAAIRSVRLARKRFFLARDHGASVNCQTCTKQIAKNCQSNMKTKIYQDIDDYRRIDLAY